MCLGNLSMQSTLDEDSIHVCVYVHTYITCILHNIHTQHIYKYSYIIHIFIPKHICRSIHPLYRYKNFYETSGLFYR